MATQDTKVDIALADMKYLQEKKCISGLTVEGGKASLIVNIPVLRPETGNIQMVKCLISFLESGGVLLPDPVKGPAIGAADRIFSDQVTQAVGSDDSLRAFLYNMVESQLSLDNSHITEIEASIEQRELEIKNKVADAWDLFIQNETLPGEKPGYQVAMKFVAMCQQIIADHQIE